MKTTTTILTIALLTSLAGNVVQYTTDDQTAAEVNITDSGGYYTGTEVETALQEVGAATKVQTGSGAPGTTPNFIGEIYVDTSGGVIYMAAGTSSSADWKQISN